MSINQGAISIEGSTVGLTSAIDESRQLQRIQNLFNILTQKRAASGLGVGTREPASLHVDPVTSGLAFASTYWTMVFAGVDPIHVEVDGAYYRTEPLVDELGQPATDFCPPPPRQGVLHAQVDREFWHLRVARAEGPIDDTGGGATNTPEWFKKSGVELIARNAIGGVVFHVLPDTQFGNVAGYLKNAIELNERAGSLTAVKLALPRIDVVSGTLACDGGRVIQTQRDIEGSTAAPRGREPQVIREAVARKRASFNACYERALHDDPRAAGRASTRFTITAGGKVKDAVTTVEGALPGSFKECFNRVFEGLTFGLGRHNVTLTYPMSFDPGP